MIRGLFDKLEGICGFVVAPKLVTDDTRDATVEPAVWLLLLFPTYKTFTFVTKSFILFFFQSQPERKSERERERKYDR